MQEKIRQRGGLPGVADQTQISQVIKQMQTMEVLDQVLAPRGDGENYVDFSTSVRVIAAVNFPMKPFRYPLHDCQS